MRRHVQRAAGGVFAITLATLIPFWVVKGTHPSGGAVWWVLYGTLIASGVIWGLATISLRKRPEAAAALSAHLTAAHRLNDEFRDTDGTDRRVVAALEAKLSAWLERSRSLLTKHAPHSVAGYERSLRFLPSTGREPTGDAFEAHGVLLDAIDAYAEALALALAPAQ